METRARPNPAFVRSEAPDELPSPVRRGSHDLFSAVRPGVRRTVVASLSMIAFWLPIVPSAGELQALASPSVESASLAKLSTPPSFPKFARGLLSGLGADAASLHLLRVPMSKIGRAKPSRLEDATTGMSVQMAPAGLRRTHGERSDGAVLYRDALGQGVDLWQKVLAQGVEDFVSFDQAPARAEVRYEVRLDAKVAGLRLVENTLEFLDEGGSPRLHVASPFLIDSDAKRTEARLTIEGCAADTSLAPPWGRQITAPGARTCTLIAKWRPDAVRYPAVLDPMWVTGPVSPINRSGDRAITLTGGSKDGYILLVGGTDSATGLPSTATELYNPFTSSISISGPISQGRTNFAMVALADGSALVSGGIVFVPSIQVFTSAERFDPDAGTWSTVGNLTEPREGHTATLFGSGKVLLAGGGNVGFPVTADIYDPSDNSFRRTAGDMNFSRQLHTANLFTTGPLSGLVLLAGGQDGVINNASELYDPATDTFPSSGIAFMSAARSQHASALIAVGGTQMVLVAGGQPDYSGNTTLRTAERFNPSTMAWEAAGSMSEPRQAETMAVFSTGVLAGQALVANGEHCSPNGCSEDGTVDLYDPSTNLWRPTASMCFFGSTEVPFSSPTSVPSGAMLPAGTMFVAGTQFGTTQVYDPYLPNPPAGTACTFDCECGEGICVAGSCSGTPTAGAANGSACSTGSDCSSTYCVANVCCGSACDLQNAASSCSTGLCAIVICHSGFANCDGTATNGCEVPISTDPANCGGCGVICSATNIAAPTCMDGICNGACDAGFLDCDGNKLTNGCEITISADPFNCGACGLACSANNILSPTCVAGVCAGVCNSGFGDCDGNKLTNGCETSLTDDPANCGGCRNRCNTNHVPSPTCASGICNGACQAGYADCNGNELADGCEINIHDSQVNNCGGCGVVCSSNNVTPFCSTGVCSGGCSVGYADCNHNKQLDGCEDYVYSDPNNCGIGDGSGTGCGCACSTQHGTPGCNTGSCTIACAPGWADCDNVVGNTCAGNGGNGCETNTQTSKLNCGGCGVLCQTNHMVGVACTAGVCNGSCATGYLDCDHNLQSDGCETNPKNDPANCGSCGVSCSTNHIVAVSCAAGLCNGNCVTGYKDCNGDKLTDGCEVALATDPNNCSKCGTVCSTNHITAPTCAAGVCNGICDSGYADCNGNKLSDGCETNPLTSPTNCGACGANCSTNHVATPTCGNGACIGPCQAGYADCNNDRRTDGCEIQILDSEVNHCGGCNIVCSANHVFQYCDHGVCSGGCNTGFADCDGNKQVNGCEAHLTNSDSQANGAINHCGTCGGTCPFTTNVSGTSCTASACAIVSCAAGFGDCDSIYSDGCETNLNTTPSACGSCRSSCSTNHISSPTCGNGICNGACQLGYGDCNGNKLADGCETVLTNNSANCGGCRLACSGNHIVSAICQNGVCGGACQANYADCDTNKLTNGCETNIATSVDNCGACGVACSSNHIDHRACSAGVCTGGCNAGTADCDNDKLSNGCEIDTTRDPLNCGGCRSSCSTSNIAMVTCTNGKCDGTCATGFADCDKDERTNGCETNIGTDIINCGRCGMVCNSNHVITSCTNGACGGTCSPGWADCNNNLQKDGCEVNTGNGDPKNCGGCGLSCSTNHVVSCSNACVAGACAGQCEAGWGDCDGNKQSNGCETKLLTDVANCGACGAACSAAGIAKVTCAAGICNGTCRPGFFDCDSDKQVDGCETDPGPCGNDMDTDGLPDSIDLCPLVPDDGTSYQTPGVGDACNCELLPDFSLCTNKDPHILVSRCVQGQCMGTADSDGDGIPDTDDCLIGSLADIRTESLGEVFSITANGLPVNNGTDLRRSGVVSMVISINGATELHFQWDCGARPLFLGGVEIEAPEALSPYHGAPYLIVAGIPRNAQESLTLELKGIPSGNSYCTGTVAPTANVTAFPDIEAQHKINCNGLDVSAGTREQPIACNSCVGTNCKTPICSTLTGLPSGQSGIGITMSGPGTSFYLIGGSSLVPCSGTATYPIPWDGSLDSDCDGYVDSQDCRYKDPNVHPCYFGNEQISTPGCTSAPRTCPNATRCDGVDNNCECGTLCTESVTRCNANVDAGSFTQSICNLGYFSCLAACQGDLPVCSGISCGTLCQEPICDGTSPGNPLRCYGLADGYSNGSPANPVCPPTNPMFQPPPSNGLPGCQPDPAVCCLPPFGKDNCAAQSPCKDQTQCIMGACAQPALPPPSSVSSPIFPQEIGTPAFLVASATNGGCPACGVGSGCLDSSGADVCKHVPWRLQIGGAGGASGSELAPLPTYMIPQNNPSLAFDPPGLQYYNNNLDDRRDFVANQNVTNIELHVDFMDTNPEDPLILRRLAATPGIELAGITPTGLAMWPSFGVLPPSLQSLPGELVFQSSDGTSANQGILLDESRVCCTTLPAASTPTLVEPFKRHTGVLLADGDVVFLKTTVSTDHQVFALWTPPSGPLDCATNPADCDPIDFDLYVKCNAMPTPSSADFISAFPRTNTTDGTGLSLDSELIHIDPAVTPCPPLTDSKGALVFDSSGNPINFWGIAIHAYSAGGNAGGQFNFVETRHKTKYHIKQLNAGFERNRTDDPTPILNFLSQAAGYFYGASDGLVYIESFALFNDTGCSPDTVQGDCGQGVGCNVCFHEETGNAAYGTNPATSVFGNPCSPGSVVLVPIATWAGPSGIPSDGWSNANARILAHEWGHYYFGFPDEYLYTSDAQMCGHTIMAGGYEPGDFNWCFSGDHGRDVDPAAGIAGGRLYGASDWDIIENEFNQGNFAPGFTPDNFQYGGRFDFHGKLGRAFVAPSGSQGANASGCP